MATGQQNINIGTADNANDGDVLRAAFRKVRKMFAEIYGDTDAENLTDTETVPSTSFDTHITEKIQDVVGAMVSGNDESNIQVTYDDSDGTLDFSVAADTNTTYTVSAADGDNADEEKIVLTGNDSSTDEIVLEAGTGLSIARDGDKITFSNTVTDSNLSTEDVEDIVGDMLTGNTETGITVTYQDSTNDIDFVVDVDDSTIEIDATNGIQLKDDGITHAKLGDRFTASSAVTAAADTEIDFDDAAVYTITSSIAVDLRFENEQIGDVKTIIVTDSGGTSSLTFDTGTNTVTTLNGTYDATSGTVNFIQVICTASNTFYVTISQ